MRGCIIDDTPSVKYYKCIIMINMLLLIMHVPVDIYSQYQKTRKFAQKILLKKH